MSQGRCSKQPRPLIVSADDVDELMMRAWKKDLIICASYESSLVAVALNEPDMVIHTTRKLGLVLSTLEYDLVPLVYRRVHLVKV